MVLFVIIIAIVISIIAVYSTGEKAEKEIHDKLVEESAKSLNDKFFILEEKYLSFVSLLVNSHHKVLLTKKRQSLFFDDYGNQDRSSWHRELRYFIENVVNSPEMIDNYRYHYKLNARDDLPYLIISNKIDEMLDCIDVHKPEGVYSADMAGVAFEQLVAQRFEMAGAQVRFTAATGDHGADLVIRFSDETIVVQCKRSATTVGNKAVQEAYAGCGFHEGDHAWVVSDAPFSRQAKELANSLAVKLVDFNNIEAALTSDFLAF